MFYIGIPTLNQYKQLTKLLECLNKSKRQPEQVIVIDNGGQFQTDQNNVQIYRPAPPLGVSASWNLLHRVTAPVDLILSNDDLTFPAHTLGLLLDCPAPFVSAITKHKNAWSLFLQRESVWETVGEYDERFAHYFGDDDYRHRMTLSGLSVETIQGGVTHHVSSTIKSLDLDGQERFKAEHDKAGQYFVEKWGSILPI